MKLPSGSEGFIPRHLVALSFPVLSASHSCLIKEMLMLIQIQRWLITPKVWRFMCFASSAVGLLCYALSSSFNHLFGKWSWWKISLYTLFSFIICLAVLFAKAWQLSNSLRTKAHLVFLVLIITSIYSFFLDKEVKAKPDAYSVVSCAAFAIMSLGLSRQTHCGFEVDLQYFFSGCLIIELMKIKLWLVTVGVSFSYLLIILRSILDPVYSSFAAVQVLEDHIAIQVHSDSQDINIGSTIEVDSSQANINTGNSRLIMPREANTDRDLGFQDHAVIQVNSCSSQGHGDGGFIKPQFMACIKALKKENLKLIRTVSKHVEEHLREEDPALLSIFYNLHNNDILVPSTQPDVNLVTDSLPSRVINNLHGTVKLMVNGGFEEECCRVYSSCRRKFLKNCLGGFGLIRLNIEDVEKKMELFESWIKASKIALRIVFPNEKRLCDRVFDGFSSAADICFMQICRYFTIRILNFANTVASGTHSPNVFLRITPKVFETLNDLLPEFESLFSDQYSVSLKNEALMVLNKLREATGGISMQLENLICRVTQIAVPDGGLHPITSEAMNCLKHVCNAAEISRNQVLVEYSMVPATEGKSSIYNWLTQIIELLESNLETKSKSYTNPALCCVFVMNNLRYIQLATGRYELRIHLGNDYSQKYREKFQQNLQLYQSSWNMVLDLLKLENNKSEAPSVVAESMKDKLYLFNMHFDETCSVQSKWPVVDNWLKEQILKSSENILLPIYGEFIGRFEDVLGKYAYEYIKYGMFDIQDRLKHLFAVSKQVNPLLQDR